MAIICKLINATTWWVLNKDSDIQALATHIMNEWVIDDSDTSNFEVTAWQVWSWKAFIEVTRTNTSPDEKYLVYVWNQQDEAKTLWSNKKIFIKVPLDNINDNTLNTNPTWSWIATIEVEDAYPVSDYYLSLAETDAGWNITDTRVFTTIKWDLLDSVASTDIKGWNWKVFYTNWSGVNTELALWTASQVLTSNGATSAPTFQSPTVDINWLSATTTLTATDEFIVNQSWNKKITWQNLKTAINKFWWTGADWAVTDADLTITWSNNTYIVKNYTSWTAWSVARTCTVTPTGCITHIKIQWDADFTNWTFNFSWKWMPWGAWWDAWVDGWANPTAWTWSIASTLFITNTGPWWWWAWVNDETWVWWWGWWWWSGINAIWTVWGGGWTWWTAWTAWSRVFYYSTLTWLQSNKFIPTVVAQWWGWGWGGSARTWTWNGTAWAAWWAWGWTLIIEVWGNLTLSSTTITCAWSNGASASDTTNDRWAGWWGWWGWGWMCVVLYNWTLTWTATPTVTWWSGWAWGNVWWVWIVWIDWGDWWAGSAWLYLIEKNNTF